MWDESLAKRGSNEIGSALKKFCENNQHAKHLVMISDACGGQTRNKFIAALCLFLVGHHPNLETIDHIFMVSGHSHMEVDSMHARIESASDNLCIYVPYEWGIVASIARKNPYIVHFFEQREIVNLKALYDDMKLTNVKVNTMGEQVHWTSGKGYSSNDLVQWLQYRKSEPNKVYYRTHYDETLPFKEIIVRRKMRNQAIPKLVSAYNKKFPISTAKLNDLKTLCTDNAIPERYHLYYDSLAGGADNDEMDIESDEDESDME